MVRSNGPASRGLCIPRLFFHSPHSLSELKDRAIRFAQEWQGSTCKHPPKVS